MRKIIILLLFVCILLPVASFSQQKVMATFYYSSHCKYCFELKEDFLLRINEKYKETILWREVITDAGTDGLSELIALSQHFERSQAKVPAILIGDTFLVGTTEIRLNLEEAFQRALAGRVTINFESDVDIVRVFNKIPVVVIILSGLAAGINPCAFAVIVFFISFLAVYGYKRREIIYVGSAYCLAVFITYLLIGLGLFQFLYSLSHIHLVIKIFYYFVAFFCFTLAGLALYDYYRYRKRGEAKEQILQLPPFLKKKITLVIGSQLREKKEKKPLELLMSAFIVGFLVSLLEAVCTGQVYVPIIVSILKYPHLRVKAFSYLLLYNFMFIVPLLAIFFLSLIGFSSKVFNDFLKKHLGLIKIVLAFVFLGLGLFVIGYETIHTYLLPILQKFVVQWVQ